MRHAVECHPTCSCHLYRAPELDGRRNGYPHCDLSHDLWPTAQGRRSAVALAPVFSTTAFPTGTTSGAPYTIPNAATWCHETTGGVSPVTFSLKSSSSPCISQLGQAGTNGLLRTQRKLQRRNLLESRELLLWASPKFTDVFQRPDARLRFRFRQVYTMSATPPPQLSITRMLRGGGTRATPNIRL